jgi:hypothetical protein
VDAPQSPVEVQPVIDGLRAIDPRLDIVWNPTAIITKRGGYNASGGITAPTFDGRWVVILRDPELKTANWREHTQILVVTRPTTSIPGVHAMEADGAYMPLGQWLVDYMRAIDRANVENATKVSAMLDDHMRRQDESAQRELDAAVEQAAHRLWDDAHREAGVAQFHPVAIDLIAAP